MLVPVTVSFSHLNWHFPKILKTHDTPAVLLVKSFHERNVIYDVSVVFSLTIYSISECTWASVSVPDSHFPSFLFFSLSRGEWNCQGVSAEFQHPRAKIILLWSPRTCWSFCWCDCQMDGRQKGLGLLRCTKCGKHRQNREERRRECEESATNLLHNRNTNTKCWAKVLEVWNKGDLHGHAGR